LIIQRYIFPFFRCFSIFKYLLQHSVFPIWNFSDHRWKDLAVKIICSIHFFIHITTLITVMRIFIWTPEAIWWGSAGTFVCGRFVSPHLVAVDLVELYCWNSALKSNFCNSCLNKRC
jgi:hypothetical protein